MKKQKEPVDRLRLRGRGSQINTDNPFLNKRTEKIDDAMMSWHLDEFEEEEAVVRTKLIDIFPKTVLSKNDSPDIPFDYSINPYNGCEHGCTYCYARNSHEYWGYSAGLDFEQKILVKRNAPQLLEQELKKRNHQSQMIVMSGNTDCYQPAERQLQLTRQCLEVFLKHKHPVGVITKNALILRDIDILDELNKFNLLRVTLSITTLNESLRQLMEPRTSSVKQRLKALELLAQRNIPVHVNMAPIIPGLNSDEIFDLIKTVGELGARDASYILLRLNGRVAMIFEDWVRRTFPDRADKVLMLIKQTHAGSLSESEFKKRMRGEGPYAEQVARMFKIAKSKFIHLKQFPEIDYQLFRSEGRQMSLF